MADHRARHLATSRSRPRSPRALPLGLALVLVGAATTAALLVDRRDDERAAAGGTSEPPLPSATTLEPTTTVAPTTTRAPRRATLVFGGDVLIHQPVWEAARVESGFDFSPMLDPIAPILGAADVALCHLEVTLARPGDPLSSYPRFRAPAELATDIAEAGFDGCSVSSNHALDFGEPGVVATLDALDAARVGHAGTARTAAEDRQPAHYVAGGIGIAHLSYSYGFNGFEPPAGKEWLVDRIDPMRVIADAQEAKVAGAELVIVSLHWGAEYRHAVTAAQQEVADALAATPGAVDLVVGHHAHVVQPISKVGGLWVVWGMGNLLSNNSTRCCPRESADGVLVSATVGDLAAGDVGVHAIAFTPTWNERSAFRVLPTTTMLADPATPPDLAADLRASLERTTAHVLSLGGRELGVTLP
jgi:poly-gamma-glutamate synthesis protein (capsule biosynthesis protein)